MSELQKDVAIGLAAVRSGMDRKTARKYVGLGKMPSEMKVSRGYRTRKDPVSAADWAWAEEQLRASPLLEGKTLFGMLQERSPGCYDEGQLRTVQRKVRVWRATKGPEKEVFFAQEHRPGKAAQTDFTHGTELGVTILGVAFAHLLCNFVLPYSNWQWVTVSLSESIAALRRGVQAAMFRLGHHPTWHQTDNSTAATHRVSREGNQRVFNRDYAAMIAHFGMKPRTTGVGEKEQNGDVESSNGALKRSITQRLIVRGSSDFQSVEAYEKWLAADPVERANRGRHTRLLVELAAMPKLAVSRLMEFIERDVTVTSWSTIRVDHNTYSVPSRMIRHTVRVRIHARHIEVFIAQKKQFDIERLEGRYGHRINYRDVIWSLVQKPGAFARHKYREEFFPLGKPASSGPLGKPASSGPLGKPASIPGKELVFRRAYDAITGTHPSTANDLVYLRILFLAATTSEADVESALSLLLDSGEVPDVQAVKELIGKKHDATSPPSIDILTPDLMPYDMLLSANGGGE